MKIDVFVKSDKPTVKEVIGFLKERFDGVSIYTGKRGDPFPAGALVSSSDIAISYISPWIIPGDVLRKTRLWNINFHPGPPEYPGIGCFNFAIYNREKSYGVTAHLMEEKVDIGKIIGVRRFVLPESYSVAALSLKSYENMKALFFETMDFIIANRSLPSVNEKWGRLPYKRKELEELCRVDPNMGPDEIARRIKATSYPGMPGAYIELSGKKFEFNPER